jgi:hypothetical protein
MTQICVIGNSHAAAIRQGWKSIAGDFPGVTLTFFAAPRHLLREITFCDGVLAPANEDLANFFKITSGDKTEIRLSEYDRIVIAGAGIGVVRFSEIYRTHRPFQMISEDTAPISESCLLASALGFLASTPGFRIARMIGTSVSFIPEPIPAPGLAESDRWQSIWSDARIRQNANSVFRKALDEAGSKLNSRILHQPQETVGDDFTQPQFSRDSMVFTLKRKHRQDDYCHMNGDYGANVLQKLLA